MKIEKKYVIELEENEIETLWFLMNIIDKENLNKISPKQIEICGFAKSDLLLFSDTLEQKLLNYLL